MHHRQSLSGDKVLSHIRRSILSRAGPIGITCITPILNLLGNSHCLLISQIGRHLIIIDDFHSLVQIKGLKIPLIPAGNNGCINFCRAICRLFGSLFHKGIHLVPGCRHGNSHLICHIFIVIHNLGRNQKRQRNLLAIILSSLNHTISKILHIII